jgi:hypothetical protein
MNRKRFLTATSYYPEKPATGEKEIPPRLASVDPGTIFKANQPGPDARTAKEDIWLMPPKISLMY